jgi:hypothetical protein
MAALAVLLMGATAYTQPPLSGAGTFEDIHVTVVSTRQAGPNTISEQTQTAKATGTLDGDVTNFVTCVTDLTGQGVCVGRATFIGSVDGHAGTLEIQNQSQVNGDEVEAAHFTIVSGTNALATLHGHGSFTGFFSLIGVYTMEYFFAP